MASKYVTAEVKKLKIAMQAAAMEDSEAAEDAEAVEVVEAVEGVDERVAGWKRFMSARVATCCQGLQMAL